MRTDINEQDLIKGLAINDARAIEAIYRQNYNMVQSLIINNNGTADDARDIFQEAMIILYEKVRAGGFELKSQLKTYIYSVTRRLWLKRLNQIRKISPEVEKLEELVPVEEELEIHVQRNMDFLLMDKAMKSLGEPCKSLLEAYYLQKKSMVEIASNFGYTNADNAKNQKYKCLMRLRKLFFDQSKNKTA